MTAAFYAGVLALIYVALSIWVVLGRWKYRVSLGDGGHPALVQRIRIHGNFAEFVPFALLLLFMLDWSKSSVMLIHVLGIMLVVGRIAHAFALTRANGLSLFRPVGVILTFLVLTISAVILIWKYLVMGVAGF